MKLKTNTILEGDNLGIMRNMPNGFVDLCYIDPPYFTQRNFKDVDSNGFLDTKDYFERCVNSGAKGLNAYLEWIKIRLIEIHRILKPTGSFYCQLDYHAVHYVKVILDEIFGYNNFKNEIIWKRKSGSNSTKEPRRFPSNTDTILFYTKSNDHIFNMQYTPYKKDYIKKFYRKNDNDEKGLYRLGPMAAPSDSPTLKFNFKGVSPPPRGWRWTKVRMEKAYSEGILVISKDKSSIRQKMYLNKKKGAIVESIWTGIGCVQGGSKEYIGWPTQKPIALLERIIKTSSNEGDLVFDCFSGSGTTLHVANNLKRKFLGIELLHEGVLLSKKLLGLKENSGEA